MNIYEVAHAASVITSQREEFRTLSLLHIAASRAFVCTEYFFEEDYFVLLGHCAAQLLLQISEIVLLAV